MLWVNICENDKCQTIAVKILQLKLIVSNDSYEKNYIDWYLGYNISKKKN